MVNSRERTAEWLGFGMEERDANRNREGDSMHEGRCISGGFTHSLTLGIRQSEDMTF